MVTVERHDGETSGAPTTTYLTPAYVGALIKPTAKTGATT